MTPVRIDSLVILREVADRHFVPPGHCARHRCANDCSAASTKPGAFRTSDRSIVVFPAPLRPISAIFSPRLTLAVKSLDDREVFVALRETLDLERMAARWPLHVESDERALDVRFREFRGLQPLDFLLARRHLRRAGTGREARDELIQLRDLLFALRVVRLDAGADLRLREHHVVVAAGIGDHRLVVDVRECVQTSFRKCRSCEMTIRQPS